MMKYFYHAVIFFLLMGSANAQFGGGVTQQGSITAGDSACWVSPNVIGDTGCSGSNGKTSANQFIGIGSAPAIAVGAAAGSGASASLTGTNTSGHISITTGTGTTASAILATITFNGTLTTSSQICPLTPIGANAVGQVAMVNPSFPTVSGFTINVAGSAVPSSTTYTYGYGPCI